MQAHAGTFLQVANHTEQVSCLRVAARAEHADQALGRRAGCPAKLLEADRRLDVIAQDRLSGVHVAAEHRIDPFAQKCLCKFLVGLDVPLHEVLEAPCSCHSFAPFSAVHACSWHTVPVCESRAVNKLRRDMIAQW